jgi:hypothetical protein
VVGFDPFRTLRRSAAPAYPLESRCPSYGAKIFTSKTLRSRKISNSVLARLGGKSCPDAGAGSAD